MNNLKQLFMAGVIALCAAGMTQAVAQPTQPPFGGPADAPPVYVPVVRPVDDAPPINNNNNNNLNTIYFGGRGTYRYILPTEQLNQEMFRTGPYGA